MNMREARMMVVGGVVLALLACPLAACESGAGGNRRATGWRFGPGFNKPERNQTGRDEPEVLEAPRQARGGTEEHAASSAVVYPTRESSGPEDKGLKNSTRPEEIHIPARATASKAELRERALSVLQTIAANGMPEERGNALEALSATPARLGGVIEPALGDKSEGLRAVAAMAAGKAKYDRASEQLRALLNDPSWYVRTAAMYAMKRAGQNVDISAVGAMLFEPSPRVRAQAAFILGELGERSALGPLREAARDNLGRANPAETRLMDLQIAEARVKLGEESALADIRAALYPARSEDLEATALACQIIGQVRDQASVNQLINLTKQKDDAGSLMPAEIRLAAAGALAKLNRQPKNAAGVAKEYLGSSTDAIRAQAASVIGESGDAESLQVLEQLLISDASGRVRVAAAAAIAKITSNK